MRRRRKVVCRIVPAECALLTVQSGITETPALQHIDIGDVLPSYTLKNEKGEDVDVATLAAEKGVIFFLVPKADTRESSLSRPLAALVSH